MIYNTTNLGKLSIIGLGCWNLGGQWNRVSKDKAIEIIRYAIDHGINYIDVSDSYGIPDGQCEIILGEALQNGYRDRVFLISKIGWFDRRGKYIVDSEEYKKEGIISIIRKKIGARGNENTAEYLRLCGHACCGRLQTRQIDLLLCHDGYVKDPTPYINAFRYLKKEGFIKHYGISTDSIETLKKFYIESDGECVACECDYSILNRNAEKEIFTFCKAHNIVIFTRGSLCSGLLSGKYNLDSFFTEPVRKKWNKGEKSRDQYEKYIKQIDKLKALLTEKKTLTEISYKFAFTHVFHPHVVVGCTSIEQLEQNILIGETYLQEDIYKSIQDVTRL